MYPGCFSHWGLSKKSVWLVGWLVGWFLWYINCCIAWCIYTYTCGNIVNTIMTNEYTSLEIYTSHTLFELVAKGLCVKGELETEQTATLWPRVPLSFAVLFLVLLSCSIGCPEGPWTSAGCWFFLQHLQPTNWTSCRTGLYHCLTPTCFLSINLWSYILAYLSIYFTLSFSLYLSVSYLHTVKWSNSSISDNSVYYQSFVCTQFKCQTVLSVYSLVLFGL